MKAGADETFSLRDIAMGQRRSELEFNLALQQGATIRTPVIRDLLKKHWQGAEHESKKNLFLPALQSWDKKLPRGFMTGFMDLVCCHNNRFYILDWKSNKRFGRAEDFDADGLTDEMARNAYFLQYLFYTVALHGFLKRELNGYNYADHFGGVFYVFLRGVEGGTDRGIFADRPQEDLITELTALMTQNEGGAA